MIHSNLKNVRIQNNTGGYAETAAKSATSNTQAPNLGDICMEIEMDPEKMSSWKKEQCG